MVTHNLELAGDLLRQPEIKAPDYDVAIGLVERAIGALHLLCTSVKDSQEIACPDFVGDGHHVGGEG